MRRLQMCLLVLVLSCALVSAVAVAGVAARSHGWQDSKVGLAIRYPAGWHLTTRNLTQTTEPEERFVLYSESAPANFAVASPAANQALAVLLEQTSLSAAALKQFPPRPSQFTVAHLSRMETFDGDRWAERIFRQHGRGFYLFIWVGAHDQQQQRTLLAAVNSLRVTYPS